MFVEIFKELIPVLVESVLVVAVPILVRYFMIWVRAKEAEIASKVGQDNWEMVQKVVWALIHAAEQAGITGKIENAGKAKFEMVMNMAQEYLDSVGIEISVEALAALVESLVKQAEFPHAGDALRVPVAV